MATKYIQMGDALVERIRVVGARFVPEGSPAAVDGKSTNCVRLQLRKPDEVVSINPLGKETLEDLWETVTNQLNGVDPTRGEGNTKASAEEPPADNTAPDAPTEEPSPETAAEAEAPVP